MTELNNCEPRKIKVLGPYTFSIGDTTNLNEYVRGGIVTQIKMPFKMAFKSFEEACKEPEFVFNAYDKLLDPTVYHDAFLTLNLFIEKFGRMPKPWCTDDVNSFIELANYKDKEYVEIMIKFCQVI